MSVTICVCETILVFIICAAGLATNDVFKGIAAPMRAQRRFKCSYLSFFSNRTVLKAIEVGTIEEAYQYVQRGIGGLALWNKQSLPALCILCIVVEFLYV